MSSPNQLNNLIKAAYEEQLKYVIEAIKYMPKVETKPLTCKQKLWNKYYNFRYKIAEKLLARANKWGAYNDPY